MKAEMGTDLVVDDIECYHSDFSHDAYLYMWIVILDRVSTARDEMWGDFAFARTGAPVEEYIEVRYFLTWLSISTRYGQQPQPL